MRRNILSALCLTLIILGLSVSTSQAQGSVRDDGVQILESDAAHLLLELTVPDFEIETINHNGTPYQLLSIDGWSRWGQPGLPDLPATYLTLGMPWPGQPQVSVVDSDSELLNGYILYPTPDYVPGGPPGIPQAVESFALDADAYSANIEYPGHLTQVINSGFIREQPLFQLGLYPFQYNPQQQSLRVYRRLRVLVTFPQAPPGLKAAPAPLPPSFEGLLQKNLINYQSLPAPGISTTPSPKAASSLPSNADYVIITHPDFTAALQPLAAYRAGQGHTVAVVEAPDIYDAYSGGNKHPDAIHDFLVDAYANWTIKPVYVLLVGDADQSAIITDPNDDTLIIGYDPGVPTDFLPSHYEYLVLTGLAPLDAWFAKLTDDGAGQLDPYPDAIIGRIPARSANEVTTVVNKILAYEQSPTVGSWMRKAVLVADDGEEAFNDDMEAIASVLPNSIAATKMYSYNPNTSVKNKLGSGALIVAYSGHGNENEWGRWSGDSGRIFKKSEITNLWNGDRLPFMTVANCFNGIFSLSGTPRVLVEEFLLIANKGGIAGWAPSALAFPSVNTPINTALHEAIFVDDDRILGSAATNARIEAYMNNPFLPLNLFESFTYLGDPAVELAVPATLGLSGGVSPGPINMGEAVTYTIDYTVSNAAQAPGLTLISRLPQYTSFQSASIPPTSVDGRTITWELGDVAAGSYSLTLVAEVGTSGLDHGETIVNEVELFDGSGGNQTLELQTTVSDRPISGLSAANDSPTELGNNTTLTAVVVEGTNVTYTWDFGDGSATKTGQSRQHTYPAVGNYIAQVTASNGVDSDTQTTQVTIVDVPPTASFVSSAPDRVGQTTAFQNTSGGTNLSYAWSFGDGGSSNQKNPGHAYTAVGTYNVQLTISNSVGSDSVTAPIEIIPAVTPPTAGFSSSSPDELGQATTFINTSDDGAEDPPLIAYLWTFGDGNTSSQKDPSHTYNAVGTYTVQLTITNSEGSDSHQDTVTIIDVPISGLSFNSSSPTNQGQATAFNASVVAGSNVAYSWNFGDGSATQNGQSVQHTYAATGTYLIQLSAVNSLSNEVISGTVEIIDAPISGLTAGNDGPHPFDGTLTTLSASVTGGSNVVYTWDFGDDVPPQVGASVQHLYPAVGQYQAQVTARNSLSSQIQTTTVTITDIPPQAGFSSSTPDTIGQTTTFQDASSGSNLAYLWNFGDGTYSAEANPSHPYGAVGLYTVVLTVSNSAGSDWHQDTVSIIDLPITGLSAVNDSPTSAASPTTFTATVSGGTNVIYRWDFDDGTPLQIGSPIQHTYLAPGNYTLRLTAQNGVSNDSLTDTVTITEAPIIGLVANSNSPTPLGSRTTLSATISGGSNVVYTWDFGDGTPSQAGASLDHIYPAVGTYVAQVTASNSVSSDSQTTTVTISDALPEAKFVSSSPDLPGQTTTFHSISSGTNLSLTWNFGDGSLPQTTGDATINHNYAAIGDYTVWLTATNSVGSHSTSGLVQIIDSVISPIAGFFSTSPDELGQPTIFTDASQDGGDMAANIDYSWQFGDGANSGDKNPTHTYGAVGLYTVTLTITNSLGSDTYTETVMITDVPISGLNVTYNNPLPSGQAGPFSALVAQGTNVIFTWDFGDGSPLQTGSAVQHAYAAAGSYSIQVTAANGVNSQNYSGLLVVQGSAPDSSIVYLPLVTK